MAAINRSVSLNVVARVAEFQREMAKLPGITDREATKAAQKMVTQFGRAEAKAALDAAKVASRANQRIAASSTTATRQIAQSGKQATTAIGQAGAAAVQQIPDVISQLTTGANPFTVLTQQGLQVVQSVSVSSSALLSLVPILSAVAVAAAAAAAAYATFTNASERAAEANGRLAARVEETAAMHDRARDAAMSHGAATASLARSTREASRDLAVLTGELDEEDAAFQRTIEAQRRSQHERIRDAQLAVTAGEQRVQAIEDELASFEISVSRRIELDEELRGLEGTLTQDRQRLSQARQDAEAAELQAAELAFERKSQRAEREAAQVEEAERRKREAAARTRQQDREAERERLQREREAAASSLAAMQLQQEREQAGALDTVNIKYRERLAQLEQIEGVLGQTEETAALRHQMEVARIAEIQALVDANREHNRQAVAQAAAQEIALRERVNSAILQSTAGLFAATASLASQNATRLAAEDEAAARKQFNTAKALNVAEGVMNTYAGATRAFKDYPFPASAAIAAATVGAGLIRVGTIASQQPAFDVGGVAGGGIVTAPLPDQQPARLLSGEAVLNRTATASIGTEGVRRLNRGESLPGEVMVIDAYRHFDRFMGDELGRGGRLTRAMDSRRNTPIGQQGY